MYIYIYCFLVLGVFHGMRGEFTDHLSETTMGFRNVVGKFTSHIVQKHQNQKTILISR